MLKCFLPLIFLIPFKALYFCAVEYLRYQVCNVGSNASFGCSHLCCLQGQSKEIWKSFVLLVSGHIQIIDIKLSDTCKPIIQSYPCHNSWKWGWPMFEGSKFFLQEFDDDARLPVSNLPSTPLCTQGLHND